jgi:hypothetical protein
MKRYLLLCLSICITLVSIAAPWDLKPKVLPNIVSQGSWVYFAQYTQSGQNELKLSVYLDADTENYTSRVTFNVYGYYRKTQLGWPQVYWEWGYKQFTVDIPPNSHEAEADYPLHAGEIFNMSGVGSADGHGEGLESGQATIISFVEI